MKKFTTIMIGWSICLFTILLNTGYAGDDFVSADNKPGNQKFIEITHPVKNSVVSGYFLPVSWSDPEVDSDKVPYPENYKKSNKEYQITVYDRRDTILKKHVSGQNYYIFTYNEIEEVLEEGVYALTVTESNSSKQAHAMKFFYEKPGEFTSETDSDTVGESIDEELNIQAVSGSKAGCASCQDNYWPGMLVILLQATTYNKNVDVYCNQTHWYGRIFSPDFNGPYFVSITGAYNYTIFYNDYIVNTYKCVNVYSFKYSLVEFP
ncbi:MAG: hypothetical protein GY749_02315 [Desulfobacteraceae bacterium]|nr:hypothetical protein [Desulfobacteraceae bacterium]